MNTNGKRGRAVERRTKALNLERREPGVVRLKNGSLVNLYNIPLVTVLRCLEEEIKAKVTDERERKVLLTRLRTVSRDSSFTVLLSTSLGQLLTKLF